MALLTGFDELDPGADTFSDWLNKTNELVLYLRGSTDAGQTSIMTANSQLGGSLTYGNATLWGQMAANSMVVFNNGDDDDFSANGEYGGLRGGTWVAAANAILTDTLYVVSNTTFTDDTIKVNVNSVYGLVVENTIDANGDVLFIGAGGSNTDPELQWEANNATLNWNDNIKATFGTGDDLEVYYTGTRGNVNTDILDIRGSTNTNIFTDDFEMRSQANNELMLTANVANGVELYWDGIKKVSSNTHGVEVYGQVIADNGFVTYNNQPIEMGGANYAAAHNFTIVTDGTDTTITETSNDLSVRVEDNFRVTDDTGATSLIVANTSGEVTLYHNNNQKMQTNAYGVEITGEANTDTLRVGSDANFDNNTLNSNSVHWDATLEVWNYRDDVKATFGDSDDWTLYYDAAGRAYSNVDNMDIRARTDMNIITDVFELKSETGPELYISAGVADNSTVRLYYEGNERLQTNTYGVEVTGQLVANGGIVAYNNQKLEMGGTNYAAAHNFEIYTDGTDSHITETGGGDLIVQANNIQIEDTSGQAYFCGTSGLGASVHYNGAIKLITTNIGIDITGQANTTTLRVQGNAAFENDGGVESMHWHSNDAVHGTHLHFEDDVQIKMGAAHDFVIYHEPGGNSYIKELGNGDLVLQANNMQLEDTSGQAYFCGTAGSGASMHFNGAQKLITTNIGLDITGEANTDTLRVQSTTLLEDDVYFDGTTADQLHWDSSQNELHYKDNVSAVFGNTDDLKFYHDDNDGRIVESTSGNLHVTANNLILEDTDGNQYVCGLAGLGTSIHYAGATKIITTNIGIDITGEANTDTLRVKSTTDLEDDIRIQGSTNSDTVTWDKSANTLNLDDYNYLTFGTGGDFTIHHDGSNTYMTEIGVGHLHVQANNVQIEDTDGDAYFCGLAGAGASIHFNGAQKLITTATGVDVTGKVVTDSLQVDGHVDLGASAADTISVLGEFDTALIPAVATANVGSVADPWDWGYFNDIVVANTATILNLEVTTLEANGVAFTGTGDDVTTTSTTIIDSFEYTQTQGFKFFVHGENINDASSGYAVEINVIVTDNKDIYYTRYGEVENNMSDVVIVPALAANTTHVILNATCGSASGTDIHRFKVLKIETRAS